MARALGGWLCLSGITGFPSQSREVKGAREAIMLMRAKCPREAPLPPRGFCQISRKNCLIGIKKDLLKNVRTYAEKRAFLEGISARVRKGERPKPAFNAATSQKVGVQAASERAQSASPSQKSCLVSGDGQEGISPKLRRESEISVPYSLSSPPQFDFNTI